MRCLHHTVVTRVELSCYKQSNCSSSEKVIIGSYYQAAPPLYLHSVGGNMAAHILILQLYWPVAPIIYDFVTFKELSSRKLDGLYDKKIHVRVAAVNLSPVSHPHKAAVAPVTNHNSTPPQLGTNRSHHIQHTARLGKMGNCVLPHSVLLFHSTSSLSSLCILIVG